MVRRASPVIADLKPPLVSVIEAAAALELQGRPRANDRSQAPAAIARR